jgi:hypothetical protein
MDAQIIRSKETSQTAEDTESKLQTIPCPVSASELYRLSDRRLLAKLVPTFFFSDRRDRVVSATDPYGRVLGFLERNRYFFFQVAPLMKSRGFPDPLLRKFGNSENRTMSSGSVARNSDH